MVSAKDVVQALLVSAVAVGLLRVAEASTTTPPTTATPTATPTATSTAAPPTTPAASASSTTVAIAAMRTLKKLEECAGGPRAVEREMAHLAIFEPHELADAHAYRRAVARKLSAIIYKAIRCTMPHSLKLAYVGVKLTWAAVRCVLSSFGSLTVMGGCMAVALVTNSWPVIVVVAKVSVCMVKSTGDAGPDAGPTDPPSDGEATTENFADMFTEDGRRRLSPPA